MLWSSYFIWQLFHRNNCYTRNAACHCGLVPFRLLPFRLLPFRLLIKMCHFTYLQYWCNLQHTYYTHKTIEKGSNLVQSYHGQLLDIKACSIVAKCVVQLLASIIHTNTILCNRHTGNDTILVITLNCMCVDHQRPSRKPTNRQVTSLTVHCNSLVPRLLPSFSVAQCT